jgi:hypothetical protein
VRTPPDGLPEDSLVPVLARHWGVAAAAVAYRPVGWGSHHWEVASADGTRWFVTADDLEVKRRALDEPLDVAFGQLRAALAAAVALRAGGASFVVAPVPARDGAPLVRANDRFAVALYPFVDGQSFEWDRFSSPAHRRGLLDILVAVHAAPDAAARLAGTDDFAIPHRDELAAAIGPAIGPAAGPAHSGPAHSGPDAAGPFARPAAVLLAEHAAGVRRLLRRYDELAALGRAQPSRAVLTHGEPHPGNTMLAAGRWLLIDWDTALAAPPERDLWSLDPGDGSVLRAYAEATGVTPRPELLELYRLRWDLADIAVDVSRFRAPHAGTEDDEQSWDLLRSLVERVAGR